MTLYIVYYEEPEEQGLQECGSKQEALDFIGRRMRNNSERKLEMYRLFEAIEHNVSFCFVR